MTNRGDVTASDLAFAEFVYLATAQWNTSGGYRRRLLSEKPDSPLRGPRRECPQSHPHGLTANCYQMHRCSCAECRTQATRRAKAYRMRRATEQWRAQNNEETRTA